MPRDAPVGVSGHLVRVDRVIIFPKLIITSFTSAAREPLGMRRLTTARLHKQYQFNFSNGSLCGLFHRPLFNLSLIR